MDFATQCRCGVELLVREVRGRLRFYRPAGRRPAWLRDGACPNCRQRLEGLDLDAIKEQTGRTA